MECQQLRDSLEEEQDSKSDLQRQISKANAEAAQWRARFEGEGMSKSEEMEEAKRKLNQKVLEVQEELEQANQRIASSEKNRHRLVQELEDAQLDAEKVRKIKLNLIMLF